MRLSLTDFKKKIKLWPQPSPQTSLKHLSKITKKVSQSFTLSFTQFSEQNDASLPTHNFVSTANWKFFEAFSLSSKGKGFLIRCFGLFVCYWFAVDECEKCDIDAICVNGHCKCKHGYYGNGYQCEKGKKNAYLLLICFRLHCPIYRKYLLLSNDQRGISTLLIQITHEQSEVHFYNQRWILSGKPFRCMKEEQSRS